MSQSSYMNIGNEIFYLESTIPTYFGVQKGYLDIHTMRYRIFGAVWKLVNERKYILGYWFADNENDIHRALKDTGFTDIIESQQTEVKEVYQTIRIEQDKENWSKRRRLHFFFMVRKPWKDLRKGWYVLKSSTNYPMILTCIQKNGIPFG
ncbi:hypothetical protein [Neobacillus sp. PS3-40]|uniref:hypothetical protein n=1 Tax=Neobacillus sp. PS3-40 TaxID=3070679 RepID=UPI0027DF50C4|nr:hypothetical protein [Neobacillus sp. PS3-40]WML44630.1 hypothetical protein RCG20_01575 [Neobacillus sp. PS3-40]